MPTLFALLLQVCGLSQREAASFLGVRLDTVKSWSAGRNPARAEAIGALAALAARIDEAADEAVAVLPDPPDPDCTVELGIAADDAEAQALGWPCQGAHRATIALAAARALAEGHRIEIVPRGSTAATAAAADVHRR